MRKAKGEAVIVRYADDYVVGFECKEDAEQFLNDIKERLSEFGLNLHPDKTRLIEFGRHAMGNRKKRGERRPETFDFLGFTHYCRKTRKGRFGLGRKPVAKRMSRTLKRIGEVLRRWIKRQGKRCSGLAGKRSKGMAWVLRGTDQLQAPAENLSGDSKEKWHKVLRRRSQKDHFTWERLERLTEAKWGRVKILHPWPNKRFAVKHLR